MTIQEKYGAKWVRTFVTDKGTVVNVYDCNPTNARANLTK